MGSLYALVVGINEYQKADVRSLRGAVNDARSVVDYLTARDEPRLLELCDGEATRDAIVAGIRRHLGQARAGDTALFWFSGHGSECALPAALRWSTPSGRQQSIVCADSRTGGVPDLLDNELKLLIAAIAERGVHVVSVLDCCHSDGVAREEALDVRAAQPWLVTPSLDELIPELSETVRDGASTVAERPYITLAACHVHQTAREIRDGDEYYGAFSRGLLHQLNQSGGYPSYRDLVTSARCFVENRVRLQQPVLRPITDPIVDLPFLGGRSAGTRTAVVLRQVRGRWEVNAGVCHGLDSGTDEQPTVLGVAGSDPVRVVRIRQAVTVRSIVEPVGWTPDPGRQYPVVLLRTPTHPTTVSVGGTASDDPRTAGFVAGAIGVDSTPLLRTVERDGGAHIVVACPAPGTVDIRDAAGTAIAPRRVNVHSGLDAVAVVDDLVHIARWLRIKSLENPLSGLDVQLDVLPATPGATPLRTDASGVVRLKYSGRQPPDVLVRVRNRHSRRLFCALLDLTDRYECHADLFPGDWIAAGNPAWIDNGQPIELSLPPGRPVRRGASVRDWLLLVAVEHHFDVAPYELTRLGEPGSVAGRRTDRPEWFSACDWTTRLVPLVTRVP